MTYAYTGTMRAKPGHRDEVVALLLRDQCELAAIGCHSYPVGVNDEKRARRDGPARPASSALPRPG